MIGQPIFSASSITLTIFSAIDLTQRTAEHREVLAEHAHPPAIDRAVTGHHRIGIRTVALHLEIRRAMPHEHVQLLERPRIKQLLDPLARRVLALRVLLLDRSRPTRVDRLVLQHLELPQLLDVRLGRVLLGLGVRPGGRLSWVAAVPAGAPLGPRDSVLRRGSRALSERRAGDGPARGCRGPRRALRSSRP